jgi:hypothetical protein
LVNKNKWETNKWEEEAEEVLLMKRKRKLEKEDLKNKKEDRKQALQELERKKRRIQPKIYIQSFLISFQYQSVGSDC